MWNGLYLCICRLHQRGNNHFWSIEKRRKQVEKMVLYYCTYLFIHTLEFIDSMEYFTAERDIMVSKDYLHMRAACACEWLTSRAIGADIFEYYEHKY